MGFKIIISPKAQLEIEEIADYYFEVSFPVLIKFNEQLMETYNTLKSNPYFQKRCKGFHAIPLKQFPFILFFKIDEDKNIVKIISCLHTSRDSEKYPI